MCTPQNDDCYQMLKRRETKKPNKMGKKRVIMREWEEKKKKNIVFISDLNFLTVVVIMPYVFAMLCSIQTFSSH